MITSKAPGGKVMAAIGTRRRRGSRSRRGVALILSLLLTLAMAALAATAIYLNMGAGLVGRMAEREKDLRYAADGALQIGKSLINNDPAALPDTGYRTLVTAGTLRDAGGAVLPGITYNLWAGPTGSTTGQFGRYASVVAEVIGPRNARFVRRLELEQESFARYSYWTDVEVMPDGTTIYFGGGDVIWGPVWTNDNITIHSSGATFNDEVTTAKTVINPQYGTFKKGYTTGASPIQLPTITALSKLPNYAAAGNLSFTAPTTGNETTVRMRLEFVAVDLNNDGDSTDVDEGFVRIYRANSGETAWLRGDWNTNKASAVNCGDFHRVLIGSNYFWKFFPVATHSTSSNGAWARSLWVSGGMTSTQANNHAGLTLDQIMSQSLASGQPPHRCFPGGDPNLVAIERNAMGGNAAGQIGGDNTTFTASGTKGSWIAWPGSVDARLLAKRPYDAGYLFPLHRSLNPNVKGVIYVNGTVGVSGVLRGRVTLYASNTVVLLDDLRYATDPASGVCDDMLGIIAANNMVVADNAINSPQSAGGSYRNFDDTKDLYIHGVIMTLDESFTVQNYSSGPTDANDCGSTNWGRGCLFLTGGLIQERRGAVGTTSGTGFLKRYSYDRCVIQIPPPYYPTTGRFLDNRYAELDPVRFNVADLFRSLTPNY
jgi:hypothetical protein